MLVLLWGGSCKFSNRSLREPPFGAVLREVGWRWLPPSQWLSVKEGAWVTVAAAQQMMTQGGCHCQVIVTTPVPRVPRALTMASAGERKYHYSDLGKAAAFLPSLLLQDSLRSNKPIHGVHGVLLFADISGFTALTEKFIQRSGTDRGTDELAQTLNCYLRDILEEMLIFGGDILKFAGDAVLVLWRALPQELAETISLVLQCSWRIQKKYGSRDTPVGQKVQLKIGISAGPMNLMTVGDGRQQYFWVCGWALGAVCEAEQLANAGEVVLSATTWEVCEQHQLRIKHLAGKRAVKVTGMDRMAWSERQDASHKLVRRPVSQRLEREGAMRSALLLPSDPSVEEVLRKYIPGAALRKFDDRVPLDLFSELRPVTILFVQLHFAADTGPACLCTMLDNAIRMMLEILCPHKGEINKVLLFDKGCTFLCVFGLTGEKLPYKSLHALQSALQIFDSCSTMLKKIEAVSVAVTSGTVFCGVTGHPVRHEYTVIGQKVNLAARMMVHYPGLVSCDAATYAASQLPPYYFKELPERKMKGLSHPGTVYQYVGITEKSIFGMALTKERSEYVPLLGREKEVDLFVSCLKAYEDLGEGHILAFEGTVGSGKSHLLTELAYLGQAAGHRVVAVELLEVNVRQSFSAIRTLMARALGLQDCELCSDRQRMLQTKLRGTIEESSYCLLNDIFLVEFPVSDEVREMCETQRKTELHTTLAKVLEKTIGGEFGIFVIDNAHFIDSASWSIMSPVLRNVSLFMVVSLAPGYARTESFWKAAAGSTRSQKITCLHLDKLKPSAVVQKACQDLGVDTISRDLARFLIQRSSGIPYYCEELLRCLRCNNMLLFRTRRHGEKVEDNWESLIIEASPLAATSSSGAGNEGRVCFIRPDANLESAVLPATLKEIVLAQLDRIKLLKQMVLKFAAVIGPVFTTQLLSHILPAGIRHKMNCLLDMLVRDNILKWLKNPEVPEDVQGPPKGPATSLQAESGVRRPSPSKKTVERQSGVLAFCVLLLREAAYELWPKSQRVALHRKCAAFLERYAHKCKSCSQGDFVAFHRFAVPSTQDGGSCQAPADQDDSRSWEALVLAGEELKRDRTHAAEGMLVAWRFLARSEQTTELPSKTDGKHNGARSCECKAIVESVLVPLARHYTAMGDAARAFYYLLECAAAYLHVSNSYMALVKLNEAEVLRNSVEEKANVIARFEEATFFSLKGEVCCHLGRMKLAKKMIREALSLLKRQFPRTSVGAFVESQAEELQCAAYVARRASSLPQEARKKRLAWLLRQSCCLSLLEHLFSLEGTSSGRMFSRLAARMKANTDRAADCYQAADIAPKSASAAKLYKPLWCISSAADTGEKWGDSARRHLADFKTVGIATGVLAEMGRSSLAKCSSVRDLQNGRGFIQGASSLQHLWASMDGEGYKKSEARQVQE
ncbi:LOW QUALITY PROTEIN: adenylate cyclase type 10-like [Mycteria americana]|uniref:LOW QUALITY PROTEIN: adenylate cyclase type 10-like n=1 Tax=Mycteria americana TaxID=33587 RepID=UPI003F5855C8